jgi:putative hydrolase of the HAD superfamily
VIRSLAHSLDLAIPHTLIQQATRERQARFDYALLNVDTEVLETLSRIKDQSIRLCLISNASTAEVAAWRDSPLAELFEKAIFSCECGMQKPDVNIFLHALVQADADPAQSVFVGDGGSNEFLGARGANLTTVFTTQFSKPSHLEKVKVNQAASIDHTITHVREVLGLLN